MSRDGAIELEFGLETRRFRLGLGELEQVQEKCDAGPGEIVQRLSPWMVYGEEKRQAEAAGRPIGGLLMAAAAGRLGAWRVQDIRAPILWGLIGGGMNPDDAKRLVKTFVDDRPKLESIPTAFLVVMAAIAGADDEPPAGEPEGEGGPSPLSPEASSASA